MGKLVSLGFVVVGVFVFLGGGFGIAGGAILVLAGICGLMA